MGEYIKVARIVKARKRQGRLVVQCCDGLPFLLEAGMTVHIVPPSLDVPRTVVVADASEDGDCLVSFEGVSDYPRLVEYVGRYCLVARDEIDPQALAAAPATAVGFSVRDEELGDLGQVSDVLESAFQATLVVQGPRGEVMIPFVDEFILDVDPAARSIRTRIPAGLADDARPPAADAAG